jgi:hypothetical protein
VGRNGVEIRASFILGLPGENRESVERTMELLGENGLPMHRVNVNIATPLPGTRMYNQALLEHNLKFVEEVKPSTESLPDWAAFRRHGNAIIEVLDDEGNTIIQPDELIELQKRAHQLFYSRPSTFDYHIRRMKSLVDLKGEPRDDAYYYRPIFFTVRELFGVDRHDPELSRVHNPGLKLDHGLIDRWSDVVKDESRHHSREALEVLYEMNDVFGYHGLDTDAEQDERCEGSDRLQPESKLGRLKDLQREGQDPLIVSQQGLE